jgi:hypothetical protein
MGWFARFINAINTEYERRIKAASQINEYGEHHGHAAHHGHAEPDHTDDTDDGVEIMNVPRGTQVSRQPDSPPPHDQPAQH